MRHFAINLYSPLSQKAIFKVSTISNHSGIFGENSGSGYMEGIPRVSDQFGSQHFNGVLNIGSDGEQKRKSRRQGYFGGRDCYQEFTSFTYN
jgi:hypothetical protein